MKKLIEDKELIYLFKTILKEYTPFYADKTIIKYHIEADIEIDVLWGDNKEGDSILKVEDFFEKQGNYSYFVTFPSKCTLENLTLALDIDGHIQLVLPELDLSQKLELLNMITEVINKYRKTYVEKVESIVGNNAFTDL